MKILSRRIDVIIAIFTILSFAGIVHIVMADIATTTTSDPIATTVSDPIGTIVYGSTTTVISDPTVITTVVPAEKARPGKTSTATVIPTSTATADPTTIGTVEPTSTATVIPTSTATADPTTTGTVEPTTTATAGPTTTATSVPTTNGTADPTATATSVHTTNGGSSPEENYGGEGSYMPASNVDPFSNIIKYEVRGKDLLSNTSVKYEFGTLEFSIYQVFVNGEEHEPLIPVRIEHLRNTSIHVEKGVSGLVYANENVWIGTKRINYISVKFKIDNSWINENDINDKYIVTLLRWNGMEWSACRVNMTDSDDSYTYFESENMSILPLDSATASMSLFAISTFPKKIDETNVTNDTDKRVQEEVVYPYKDEIYVDDPKKLSGFDITMPVFCIVLSVMIIRKRYRNV
jgi:PGF-pre-PGF domain-containing protein